MTREDICREALALLRASVLDLPNEMRMLTKAQAKAFLKRVDKEDNA